MMATYDQRKVGESDIAAWSMIIGKFAYEDARDAVAAHYAATDERIMPAHIARFVKARQEDLRQRPAPDKSMAESIEGDIPDADPDDVQGYIKALREGRMRAYDDGTARPRPVRALLGSLGRLLPGGSDGGE